MSTRILKNQDAGLGFWPQQYEIIENIIKKKLAETGQRYSRANAATLLGVTPAKIQAWGSGQRPVAEDLLVLARELELSADWLLVGRGDPSYSISAQPYLPDYLEICDTLFELLPNLPDKLSVVAQIAGMSTTELLDCMHGKRLPSAFAISKWVLHYRINANFVLAQIGKPFLSDRQFEEAGPLDRVRTRRGDHIDDDTLDELVAHSTGQPMTIRRLAPNAPSDPACIVGPDDKTPVGHVVPVHNMAAAGPALDRWEPVPICHVCVPLTYYRETILVVQISGRSMEPEIRSGAFVGLDTAQVELVPGERYGVRIPYEGLTVKRVFIDPKAKELVLRSINPEHPEMRVDLDDRDGLIVGRAVWVMQSL